MLLLPLVLEASVIVPTKQRAAYLRVALASLMAQDLDPASFEVIVVDDGPSADTRDAAGSRSCAASEASATRK